MKKLVLLALVAFVLVALIPSFVQISYAGTPAGTITYSGATDTITVVGANSSHPAEFLDLYNADVAGGWGQITQLGSHQWLILAKLMIGNGTTSGATYFTDGDEQVWFDECITANYQYFINVTKNSVLTLGTLVNSTLKTAKRGCDISFDARTGSTSYYGTIIGAPYGEVYLYSCTLRGVYVDGGTSWYQAILSNSSNKVYQCVFDAVTLDSLSGNWDTNVLSGNSFYYVNNPAASSSINNMFIRGTTAPLRFFGGSSATIRNLEYVGTAAACVLWGSQNNDAYVIDSSLSNWLFTYTGTSSGKLYRQYSFDLYVLNGALTDFVEDANVTLVHDGVVFGSWLTNSTGQIDTETLTYGFYNQTGGNTMYGGTAWTLTISHPDWQTYTSTFYPYSKIEWSISMQDTSTTNNNLLLSGLFVGVLCFAGFIVYSRRN